MIPSEPTQEIFVIKRDDGKYYVYAPIRRTLAVVNSSAVAAVSAYLTDGKTRLPQKQNAVIEKLKEQGVLSDVPCQWPVFPDNYDFRPHEVTLFPTSRCNLRCRYCYADAGKKNIDMPPDVAKAAIDLVARNAGLLGNPKFAVGFHGGGEPTLAWDLLTFAVDHAKKMSEKTGLDVELFAATNGLLSPKQMEFMAKHFTSVNVSLDGPKDIQDVNRPTAAGSGSYDAVSRTLAYFVDKGVNFGIRATITAATVLRMSEIVEHISGRFHPSYLHLEPAWHCGRCLTTGEIPPSDQSFIENFIKAAETGKQIGIDIHYSGARLDVLTSKFCAAPGDGFAVLPEGIATSCYEITEADDPRALIFHYGAYDRQNQTFVFDLDRIKALQKLSVENIAYCRDCFCRWHCAGDCLSKVFEKSGSNTHEGSIRCELNRALTLHDLDALVDASLEQTE